METKMRYTTRIFRVSLIAGQITLVLLSAGLFLRSAERRRSSGGSEAGIPPVSPRLTTLPPDCARRTDHLPDINKRRLTAVLAALTALVGLAGVIGGTTMAILSSTAEATPNSFAADTVTLGSAPPTGTCSAAALLPDATTKTCSLQVAYAGSPAWMGVDVFIATAAGSGSGAENLYNPGAPDNPPSITVSTSLSFSLPTAAAACPAAGPLDGANYSAYADCYTASDLLVSTSALSTGTVTFNTSISIPTTNGSNYQGGTVVVVIRPHVIQSANNSVGTCTAGTACSTLHWS